VRPLQPALLASAFRIVDLSFGQMLWSRRSLLLAILVGAPVVFSALIRTVASLHGLPRIDDAPVAGPALFGAMVWLVYVHVTIPVLGVFYGTALIADEVDDKTITYLFTRPIPRRAVLFGKYLAYLACTILLVWPSILIVYFLIVPIGGGRIGQSFPLLLADLGVLALGLVAYGAVFSLVGARLKRPLVIGLVFAFGWEPGVMLVPGYLRHATVAYYLRALVPHPMPLDSGTFEVLARLFDTAPSLGTSLACLTAISAAALWWAGRVVEHREYLLDQ
jgi:hypothetical protein